MKSLQRKLSVRKLEISWVEPIINVNTYIGKSWLDTKEEFSHWEPEFLFWRICSDWGLDFKFKYFAWTSCTNLKAPPIKFSSRPQATVAWTVATQKMGVSRMCAKCQSGSQIDQKKFWLQKSKSFIPSGPMKRDGPDAENYKELQLCLMTQVVNNWRERNRQRWLKRKKTTFEKKMTKILRCESKK